MPGSILWNLDCCGFRSNVKSVEVGCDGLIVDCAGDGDIENPKTCSDCEDVGRNTWSSCATGGFIGRYDGTDVGSVDVVCL